MASWLSLHQLDHSYGTQQLHAPGDHHKLILHPTPNPNDPNDPLRWPRWKKHVCFACVCAFTFLTNYAIGGLTPAFYILSIEFTKSQNEVTGLLLWPVLVLGAFNFFWVPLANYFGKRPVFVLASLLLACAYLWGALATSFQSLLWSNLLGAFAGSSTEALGAATVNDLYFLHERGHMMSIYMNAIAGGNTVGPLICGFIVTGLTWRWHKWIAFILTALTFLSVLFFVPETRYPRANDASPTPSTSPSQPSLSLDKSEIPERVGEKDGADSEVVPSGDTIPKKTYIQELSFFSGRAQDENPLLLILRPFPLIAYPAVIYGFLTYAVSLAWVIMIGVLNPFVLQAPPYNWPASTNGLINIPALIGNLVGSWLGGWVVDRYSDWRSKKNAGVFEPETRLHLLVIPALIVPAGCLAFGYGVGENLTWVAMFFGYGMVSVGLTAFPTATATYISDSYLAVNADALLLVNGLKNIVAFGFLYGISPWIANVGYINAFGTQAGIYVFIALLGVPLAIWGRSIRRSTASWPIILDSSSR